MPLAMLCLLLNQQPLPVDHPAVPEPGRAPSTEELVKRLDSMKDLADKDKTFEVAASLGRLYYAHGRYADAVTFLQQALGKAKPARDFYTAQKKLAGSRALPPAVSVGCAPKPDDHLDALLEAARAKAKTDAAAAAACARAALHPLIEVETQLGNARFLTRDAAGALAAYDSALELFDSNLEARYGRAAILLDTRGDEPMALEAARSDFERFLREYPASPRAKQARALLERTNAALAAGGLSKLAAAPAPRAERQGGPDAGLTALIAQAEDDLAHGRYQQALDAYKQVMPVSPDDPRLRAGMAWSLVRLDKPMAARVWAVAASNPAALDALGDALKARGDAEGAKLLWQKLKDSVPDYGPKVEAKLR